MALLVVLWLAITAALAVGAYLVGTWLGGRG